MEKEKLTLQDCFKYFNARIKFMVADKQCIESVTDYVAKDLFRYGYIGDSKLILRPLSSLTDKEKSKIKKIYFTPNIKSDDVGYLTFKVDGYSEEQIWYDDIKIADYLRSINIDIDGLQEKGVAIYE